MPCLQRFLGECRAHASMEAARFILHGFRRFLAETTPSRRPPQHTYTLLRSDIALVLRDGQRVDNGL